jgi:hypothetical protein
MPQAAGTRRYGSDLQEKAIMIGSISGASALLSQLLNAGSSSTNPLSATANASSGSSGVSASGSTATQDLQSFMSALIQELRQSGAAATTNAGTPGTAATSAASGGASVAAAGARHGHGGHGHGGHSQVSNQLESLLQQLGSPSAIASATGSVMGLPSANSGSQTASNLQASFQRLMQDVSSTQKPRGMMHATA